MGVAKEIRVKVIPASIANPFVKKHHYSGKVVNNSKLHFGVFIGGKLHGVMSFGSPMDKSKVIGLVVDENGNPAPWNDMLELNRMAFDEVLPKNSESRSIAIAIRLIKKNAPNIKWILSFADGCQCGDGTIYRASGFKLTQIKKNSSILKLEDGTVIHEMPLRLYPNKRIPALGNKTVGEVCKGAASTNRLLEVIGGERMSGHMLRYIKIIDNRYRLAVPELPYSSIDKNSAGMYKGEKITQNERNHE